MLVLSLQSRGTILQADRQHRERRVTAQGRPQDLVHAFAAALNGKDPEALGRPFVENAEFVNIRGMRMRGREGIVAGHAWAFSGPLRGRRVRFDEVDELAVTTQG
jgi:uncharacterized protein (TIGR02246 family)